MGLVPLGKRPERAALPLPLCEVTTSHLPLRRACTELAGIPILRNKVLLLISPESVKFCYSGLTGEDAASFIYMKCRDRQTRETEGGIRSCPGLGDGELGSDGQRVWGLGSRRGDNSALKL